jgi:hypothetical protein
LAAERVSSWLAPPAAEGTAEEAVLAEEEPACSGGDGRFAPTAAAAAASPVACGGTAGAALTDSPGGARVEAAGLDMAMGAADDTTTCDMGLWSPIRRFP